MSVQENEMKYPSIVFKVKNGFFAIDSKNVASIMPMPATELLPDAPDTVLGIFKFREKILPVVSLRKIFGMPTLEVESIAFSDMLEHRKQDHVRWVEALNRTIEESVPFTLATDPHQCAFGKWYDSYQTDNNAVRFLLNKIEEPHRRLHETALEVFACQRDCEHCKREECLRVKMTRLENIYMPQILSILDEAKELFQSVYRNMLIVVELGSRIFALAVDEVLAVEELLPVSDVAGQAGDTALEGNPYIAAVQKSAKMDGLILMVDEQKLADVI